MSDKMWPRAAITPWGWCQQLGTDFYRASRDLMYRIDDQGEGLQVIRMDLRSGSETYGIAPFGPRLKTLIGARALIEGDVHERMKGQQ
jgi:hypothetical protein